MMEFLSELRILLAEKMLAMAMAIAPASRPDGALLVKAGKGYFAAIKDKAFPRRHWY